MKEDSQASSLNSCAKVCTFAEMCDTGEDRGFVPVNLRYLQPSSTGVKSRSWLWVLGKKVKDVTVWKPTAYG